MSVFETPAFRSIGSGEILPDEAYRYADFELRAEGVDPSLAFYDDEINRHHRAMALRYLAILEDQKAGLMNQSIEQNLDKQGGK